VPMGCLISWWSCFAKEPLVIGLLRKKTYKDKTSYESFGESLYTFETHVCFPTETSVSPANYRALLRKMTHEDRVFYESFGESLCTFGTHVRFPTETSMLTYSERRGCS